PSAAAFPEVVVDQGLDLELVHSRPSLAHRLHMRGCADPAGLTHDLDFLGPFEKARLAEQLLRVTDREHRPAGTSLRASMFLDAFEHLAIPAGIQTDTVMNLVRTLEQLGQTGVELVDDIGLIGSEERDGPV